jgi:hypothetical protein
MDSKSIQFDAPGSKKGRRALEQFFFFFDPEVE